MTGAKAGAFGIHCGWSAKTWTLWGWVELRPPSWELMRIPARRHGWVQLPASLDSLLEGSTRHSAKPFSWRKQEHGWQAKDAVPPSLTVHGNESVWPCACHGWLVQSHRCSAKVYWGAERKKINTSMVLCHVKRNYTCRRQEITPRNFLNSPLLPRNNARRECNLKPVGVFTFYPSGVSGMRVTWLV